MDDITKSYNAFGFKLLEKTREFYPGENVFISPIGLATALSMLAEGAQCETLREIRMGLQLTNSMLDLTEANRSLLRHLASLDAKVTLKIANSIWTAQDAKIKSSYLATLHQSYLAEAASVDFTDLATVQRMNSWCNDHTAGKIPSIVEPPLQAETRLILLDAIYFKGDWLDPFNKTWTEAAPFTLGDGKIVSHPLMNRRGDYAYYEDRSVQAVYLPYADGRLGMYVFLPKKNLSVFLQSLTWENWQRWTAKLSSRNGRLSLPRFRIERSYKLKGVLKALSVRTPFDPLRANFHGIAEEPLCIDWVQQKTYIDVNEQGTEAAAVTGMLVAGLLETQQEEPFRMIVDHPFFMAICDEQTGVILFMGAIVDPR